MWEFQITEDYIACGSDCNLELKYSHEEKLEVPSLMIREKGFVILLDGTYRMLSRLVRKDQSVLINTLTEEKLAAYTR